MRIAVTGATGNIGTSLLQVLSANPEVTEVVGIARRVPDLVLDKVKWHRADVTTDDLEPAFTGADAVVHLAWTIQPSHRFDELNRINVGGTKRVFAAAVAAGVPALVHMSSVGAYSPGPKNELVDENHETFGIASSQYSRDKAMTERMFEVLALSHPEIRCVSARPALVLKREAGAHVRRVFLGKLIPVKWLSGRRLAVLPDLQGLRFQAVHSDDVARALAAMVMRDVRGAFNLAAEPVLDADSISQALGARKVRVPTALARAAVDVSWKLRIQPTDPGWLDITLNCPLLDSTRAQKELDWTPRVSATDALREVFEGATSGAGYPTATLHP